MEAVLLVDDETNVLNGLRRQLYRSFDVHIACGGEEALRACESRKDFQVVVSDMQMPGMNGVEFLERVAVKLPNAVRIMLTGNSDQRTAVDAVNSGRIFRFLNKPCSHEDLKAAIEAGITQYRLVNAEKELLSKTLVGSVKILTDVLSLVNPNLFGRSHRIKSLARDVAERMELPNVWEVELAALLSQVGCVTVPADVLNKHDRGAALLLDEQKLVDQHPQIGAKLISNIARLKGVSEIVANQKLRADDSCPVGLTVERHQGALILRAVNSFDRRMVHGESAEVALVRMKECLGDYSPDILDLIADCSDLDTREFPIAISVRSLRDGMVLAQDLATPEGVVLVGSGQVVTQSMRFRLENHLKLHPIEGDVLVFKSVAKSRDRKESLVGAK